MVRSNLRGRPAAMLTLIWGSCVSQFFDNAHHPLLFRYDSVEDIVRDSPTTPEVVDLLTRAGASRPQTSFILDALVDAGAVSGLGPVAWLETVSVGFGKRFGPALHAAGYETLDDLKRSQPSAATLAKLLAVEMAPTATAKAAAGQGDEEVWNGPGAGAGGASAVAGRIDGAHHPQVEQIIAALSKLDAVAHSWLHNNVKAGYTLKFGDAFTHAGWEDEDDIKLVAPNLQTLALLLRGAGGTYPQIRRVQLELVRMTGAPLAAEPSSVEQATQPSGNFGGGDHVLSGGSVHGTASSTSTSTRAASPAMLTTETGGGVHHQSVRDRHAIADGRGAGAGRQPGSSAGSSAATIDPTRDFAFAESAAASTATAAAAVVTAEFRNSTDARSSRPSTLLHQHQHLHQREDGSRDSESTYSPSPLATSSAMLNGSVSAIDSNPQPIEVQAFAENRKLFNAFSPRNTTPAPVPKAPTPIPVPSSKRSASAGVPRSQATRKSTNVTSASTTASTLPSVHAIFRTKHAMLSYQWDSQDEVKRARELLEQGGVPCWMDLDNMESDIYDSMAEGVQGAACVICFMTQAYQDSTNCKLELKFAQQSGVAIIPVMLNDNWRASDWLGIITAG